MNAQHIRDIMLTAQMATQGGHPEAALQIIDNTLAQLPLNVPFLIPCLVERAEALWHMGRLAQAVKCMEVSLTMEYNPFDESTTEAIAVRWRNRVETLFRCDMYQEAERGCLFALVFWPKDQRYRTQLAETHATMAYAKFQQGNSLYLEEDIKTCNYYDPRVVKGTAQRWRDQALKYLSSHDFAKAIRVFEFCLQFHPEDSSVAEFRRSILSQKAGVHFKLHEYENAIKAGHECYNAKQIEWLQEAERWKERGRILSVQAKRHDLLPECYTLAINFTPAYRCEDLLATLYSNRSVAYKRHEKWKEALADARQCVKFKPTWSKAYYRLGSSLFALKKNSEAMDAFCSALNYAIETNETNEQYETLMQIIAVSHKLTDCTARATFKIPRDVAQKAVDVCIHERDWTTLYVLFLGGGGAKKAKKNGGGLATGCDASAVKLEQVIMEDNVPDLEKFVSTLLNHKTPAFHRDSNRQQPLDVALERKKFVVWEQLLDKDTRAREEQANHQASSDESVAARLVESAVIQLKEDNLAEAVQLLNAAKRSGGTGIMRYKILEYLAEAEFKQGNYDRCLEAGRELQCETLQKSEALANKWKARGNELLKIENFDRMVEFYDLAIKFVPGSNTELRATLLSNRSMANIRQKAYSKAQKDARQCIATRPKWFRGYYRLASCLEGLKRYEDALHEYCQSYEHARNDSEKRVVAHEIFSTAMACEEGASQIESTISPKILNMVINDVVEKGEIELLRYLFLGSREQQTASRKADAIASQCDASCVPLDLLLQSDVNDQEKLLATLVKQGALCDGIPKRGIVPLKAALETENYAFAVALLKKGADPACVLGHSTFIRGQGTSSSWLNFGRKAMEAQKFRKAVMFLCVCLELADSSTEKSVLYESQHLLSEAYFQLDDPFKCLLAGNECFEMKSNKSVEEAMTWNLRGNKLYEKQPFASVDCFNMAANYVPANNRKLLVEVLCKRSEARQKNDDYHGALEDAKNVTKFQPELFKGHLNLLQCYKKLGQDKEAMQAINECLKRSSQHESKYMLLSDALSIASRLQGDTTAITVDIPSTIVTRLIVEVVKKHDWNKLGILYLGGGGRDSYPVGGGGLASGCDASEVPIEEVISSSATNRFALVSKLLKNGAYGSGRGGGNSGVIPLAVAIRQKDLALAEDLVKHKANPCALTADGQTPLHEALRIGNSDGNFQFLHALLKSHQEGIHDAQDVKGDTLYHYIARGNKCTHYKCKAIKTLRDANVNPWLRNKQGKLAIDHVRQKSDRWKLLKSAMDHYDPTRTTRQAQPDKDLSDLDAVKEECVEVFDTVTDEVTEGDVISEAVTEPKATPGNKSQKKKTTDDTWQKIQALIQNLDVGKNLQIEEIKGDDEEKFANKTISQRETAQPSKNEVPGERKEVLFEDATDKGEESEEVSEQIDLSSPFENLPWEVDCTDDVWRILRSKKMEEAIRRRIITKIRMLAEGRWSATMCKRLEGSAKQHDILLYEAKLTKGARILWEKTIAFSARCSQDAQFRVHTGQGEGLIYSEIIRVWDVVLDHDALERRIENIVKSHNRGLSCIVKKHLKGIKREEQKTHTYTKECLPNYYVAKSEDCKQSKSTETVVKRPSETLPYQDELANIFFPPASANDQEYHILKFYSFSTALVKTILEGDNAKKVDFPFKVTELEDAIIRIRQNPPCPVILLGRSGTGKTTCCLYRLWSEFQAYWDGAVTAGPHMPKYIQPATGGEAEIEEEERTGAGGSQPQEDVVQTKPGSENEEELATAVSEDEDARNSFDNFEHLHQLFITKNSVLCSEVQKNFRDLFHACPSAIEHTRMEEQALPGRIQDVDETAWPLFINSRDWLLLLDASLPGEPFFKRNSDGSLSRRIEGWGEEDNHLQYIPANDSDDDEDNEEDDDENQDEGKYGEEERRAKQVSPKEVDPRREITYQVFKQDIWPKMEKKVRDGDEYHPTLVWTEIRSFIKGSAKALLSENGVLSLEDYHDLGKKMAPNFSADIREEVYRLFEIYQRVRSNRRMFDEADLVFNLHRRLQAIPTPEWSIHRLYVDETQDFSQSELSLLIRCCRHPNDIFFTGDTAQSIMRGIAFRFNDLKSLFFYAKEAASARGHRDVIKVPDRLFQLTHNYRSHAGILRLASSVVDLLLNYFPESFDRLEKDQGMFEGPKPVILQSCSLTDLAMIMRGNRRQTSRIEFGAHQAILVASDEARNALPEELKHGLVMTIYEAKGLEFDDVLIYNFFKDSQASKEWRVVTSVVKDVHEKQTTSTTGLVELSEEELQVKSRPLEFDSEKHKVLNSEFKYLYTAITRARVNVWFFDEDETNRSPMFEYFQTLGLVEVVSREDTEEGQESLTRMFAEKSTPTEWRERGMFFYKKRMWEAAVQCFTFAGDELMVRKSRAQQQAAAARRWLSQNRGRMREEFLKAAFEFIQCNMMAEAEVCLHNARGWLLLAQFYRKTGQFAEAAKLFRKEKHFEEASDCYETINNYNKAVEVLCRANLYKKAIDVLERYNTLATEGTRTAVIIPPNPFRTVDRLCFNLASEHHKNKEFDKMEAVLQRLPSTADRINFLKKHGCIDAAVRAMIKDGRNDEASKLLWTHGKFLEASKYSAKPLFVADCMMAAARTASDDGPAIPDMLTKAEEVYRLHNEKSGQAEALVMLGSAERSMKRLEEAGKLFNKTPNFCGACECIAAMFELGNGAFLPLSAWIILRAIERLVNLIKMLHKPISKLQMADEEVLSVCEKHFGLFKSDVVSARLCYTRSGSRFSRIAPDLVPGNASNAEVMVDITQVRRRIGDHLIDYAIFLVRQTHKCLEATFVEKSLCREHPNGFVCDAHECKNPHIDTPDLFHERFTVLLNLVNLDAAFSSLAAVIKQHRSTKDSSHIRPSELSRSCERLYELLFSATGLERVKITNQQYRDLRCRTAVRGFCSYAEALWKDSSDRLSDVDRFLQVSRILELIGSSIVTGWICQEESALEQDFKRKKTRPIEATRRRKDMGLVQERGAHQSFFHWWEEGRRLLLNYGRVHDAAHNIVRRFLSLPAKRKAINFPSIANTVMILEYQLTACLASYARLKSQTFSVCLPASYLAAVQFWDNVRCTNSKCFTLYDAVEHQATRSNPEKLLSEAQSLLMYMVHLMCGRVSSDFDVVGDAFEYEGSTPEDAERTLVLALTMLCNCGKGIPFHCDVILLKSLWEMVPVKILPDRVQRALDALKVAGSARDVVVTLQGLLQSRNEKLYDLCWRNYKLWYDASVSLNPFRYSLAFRDDLVSLRARIQASETHKRSDDISEEDQGPEVLETYEEMEESETVLPQELEEQKRMEREKAELKNDAARKIQEWFRQRREDISKRELTRALSKEESKDLASKSVEHFAGFKVDVSACGICGEEFTTSLETEGGEPGMESGQGNETTAEVLTNTQLKDYERHVNSPAHHRKDVEFTDYKNLYQDRVAPVLSREQSVYDALQKSAGATGSRGVELDLQRLRTAGDDLRSRIRSVESSKTWNEANLLHEAIKALEREVQKVEKIVHHVNASSVEDEEDEEYLMEDGGGEHENEHDIVLKAMPASKERRAKKRRKKPKGHRNNKS